MHKRKMARHAKSQLLYLQMIMLKVDSEYAQYILSVHKARLNYTQPLNNSIYTPCEYSFEMDHFLSRLYKIYLSIIYVHKNLFAPQTWDLLEKLVLLFLYNFDREHGLIKLIRKKIIAENQCEKHKKLSLAFFLLYLKQISSPC